MGKVIGIDLGTTNSVVAAYIDGETRILEPMPGQRTMPSIVAFLDGGGHVVGEVARREQVTNPDKTVYSIKRFMGRRVAEVSSEERLVPYDVIGKATDFVQVRAGRRRFTPQQISAMLLSELRALAEKHLGEKVDRAIITVPAYFNDAQRQATRDAGRIAGLEVERIINEPTAAALAYGVEKRGSQTVVVFDFGGGTFDLSAMKIGGGAYEVLGVHGNTHLGGDDFDQRIIDVVADDFKRRELIDLRDDPMALQRLKQAAQQAKAELSSATETTIMVPYVCIDGSGPKHVQYTLTRETFEQVCADLFDDIATACRTLLREANLGRDEIDGVILVGGSTRIPKVHEIAKEVFDTEQLDRSLNPDEVVAQGAALLGGVIQGDLHNVDLMDVTAHGFGVEAANGIAKILVPKNTPIPTTIEHVFTTPSDNQTSVPITVLEGESDEAADNRHLGIFRLKGIRRAKRGVPRIQVKFDIDANGMLTVSATDLDTKRSQEIVVTGRSGIDEEEIDRLQRDAEANSLEVETQTEQVELRNHAEGVVLEMRKWLEHNGPFVAPKEATQVSGLLQKLSRRIEKNDIRGMRTLLKKLDAMSHIYRKAG